MRDVAYYKSYSRLPKIALEMEAPPQSDFFDVVSKRRSRRKFASAAISKSDLSALLISSCGISPQKGGGGNFRAYPSAGARFPIEIYPIVFRSSENLKSGLYHYSLREHALDVLWDREFTDEDIDELFTYPWVKRAAVAFVMTAVFWRTNNKYGERGHRYILLEAGHIGQNIYLTAEALGLACCALGGTRDKALEQLLDIDGVTESVVYAVAAGKRA
jgi:SagB-type dehydrogenase family enzyme